MRARKALILLLGWLLIAAPLANVTLTTAQEQVSLRLMPVSVGVAETAALEGRITCPAAGCGSVSVVLNFDRTMLKVEGISLGPALGGSATVELDRVDNVLGTVYLRASAAAPAPAGTDDLLFLLNIGGLIPGDASITVTQLEATDAASGAVLAGSGEGAVVQVVETGKIAFFSPPAEGWEVAFTSERDGNPEIYAASADGGNVRRLTDHPALDGGPTWSPDGSRIAFHSMRDGNLEVYVMDQDGSNVRRLTDNPADDTDPAWSPDGSQIVFASKRDNDIELYVMNADGSDPRRLTTNPGIDTYPAWSPNGGEIAFSSLRGGATEVHLMSADGSTVTQLTSLFGANGWYPAWRPDGALLAFTVERDNAGNIYSVEPKGQSPFQITRHDDILTSSDWSPDGAWLAYMARPEGNAEILVTDAQGRYVFRVTNDPAADTDPDWRAVAPPVVVTGAACTIRTDRQDVDLRVGPGFNRGVFDALPADQDFTVLGQVTIDSLVWWQLDKNEIEGGSAANSLWVAQTDVQASGDCSLVMTVDVPPIVQGGPTPTPPGQWGGCGSCESCGHPANECVLSPEGACLWDPSTCAPPPPPGSGCFTVTTQVQPRVGATQLGSIGVKPVPNCPNGPGYTAGTAISVTVSNITGVFDHWNGTCPGASGSNPNFSFNITFSCTAIACFDPASC